MILEFEAHCLPLPPRHEAGPQEIEAGGNCLSLTLVSGGDCGAQGADWGLLVPSGRFILAGEPVRLSLPEGTAACSIAFQGAAPAQMANALDQPLLIEVDTCTGSEGLFNQLAGGTLPQWEASSLGYSLLCRLSQASQQGNGHLPVLVSLTIAHIQAHYNEVYGIAELAGQLGVSKSHLVRCFSAAVGITPGRYLTEVRINAAKQLLVHRQYPLESVAALCGFSGANYLCKVFKQQTGLTPAKWRQETLSGQTTTPLPEPDREDESLYL